MSAEQKLAKQKAKDIKLEQKKATPLPLTSLGLPKDLTVLVETVANLNR
jgi:hypothetical protein